MRGVNGVLMLVLAAVIAGGIWFLGNKPQVTSDAPAPKVNFVGDLRLLPKGELKGKAQLADLTKGGQVYGIGMLDGLASEVLVLNSKALVSKPENGKFVTSETAAGNVAFGVYAHVPEWREVALPETITTFDQLQDFIPKAAAEGGLDASKPIPVRVVAEAQSLNWFIVNGTGNGKPDLREAFARRLFKGGMDDVRFEAFGLYSKAHRGIYTSANANLHLHFKVDKPELFVAHLDNAVTLKPGGKLFVPFKDATVAGIADAASDAKAGDAKAGDAKTSETKPDAKPGDKAAGDKSAGEKAAGDKPADAKADAKPAEAKPAAADAKPADAKADAKPVAVDAKADGAKPADAKATDAASDAKAVDGKPAAGDAKPTDAKSSDAMKPTESKPAAADAKPSAADAKPAAADAKPVAGDAKPVEAKPADAKPGDMKLAPAPDAPGALKPVETK